MIPSLVFKSETRYHSWYFLFPHYSQNNPPARHLDCISKICPLFSTSIMAILTQANFFFPITPALPLHWPPSFIPEQLPSILHRQEWLFETVNQVLLLSLLKVSEWFPIEHWREYKLFINWTLFTSWLSELVFNVASYLSSSLRTKCNDHFLIKAFVTTPLTPIYLLFILYSCSFLPL